MLKLKRNNENTATINEGINVKTENIEIYFKFVCDPTLFFFHSKQEFITLK